MADADLILETRRLTKQFNGFTAVNGVDLRVRRGTIHALIGPNGAGQDHMLQPVDQVPDADAQGRFSSTVTKSRARRPHRSPAAGWFDHSRFLPSSRI